MSKFKNGAFVFTRARKLVPRTPAEIVPLAHKYNMPETIVPAYAGDRTAVGRAIQSSVAHATKNGFLLRPIKRNSTKVTYAVVKEESDGVSHVEHQQSDLIKWHFESPDTVTGSHPIAERIGATYRQLQGKIVGDDWTGIITSELDRLGAVSFREDGRVYWLPPQSLADTRKLAAFLDEVGVVLVLAEVEANVETVVTEVVAESVADQLERLQQEVATFDGDQKPSTYARRLDEYQRLKQKAILYRDSLGVGMEQAMAVLTDLEAQVGAMLDIRKSKTVSRTRQRSPQANRLKAKDSTVQSLTFADATFTSAGIENGVHKFTSGDTAAIASIKALESMGIAGKWQTSGNAKVRIQNSGPKGAEVSVDIEVPKGMSLASTSQTLKSFGITVQ